MKPHIYHPINMPRVLRSKKLLSLWYLLDGYHLYYLAATVFLAISAFARTGMYQYLGQFVDGLLEGTHSSQELIISGLSFVALILLQAFSTLGSSTMASFAAENSTRRLRDFLFDHIQRLPFAYHAEAKTGDLLERATSDVDTMRRFFSDQAIGIGRIVFIFAVNFIAVARLNLKLALVSIAILPITLVTSTYFYKKIFTIYDRYQEEEAIVSTNLQENLSGVRVVKAFARQDYENRKFEANLLAQYKQGIKLNVWESTFWPLSDGICALQQIASSLMAAMMVISGDITLGNFITFSGLLSWLIWPIRNLGRLIIDTSRALVAYGRISTVLHVTEEDLQSAKIQPLAPVQGAIRFEQVSFEYEAGHPVLDDVSFDCQPGQVIALLGSTGSGKTSLVKLLPRFYDVSSGAILLDGHDLRDYSRDYLRKQIGIVEQEPFLFSCSIRDNITYGMKREVSQAEVEQAAREAAMHDVIMGFQNGYDTLVGERGVTLSGGQKQRMAIARTLLINPRILILDDSTSSVDMETEVQIRAALNNLMQSRTTFVIAHRVQSIMNADLILVFDQGHIVQRGKHEDLLAEEGIYRQIYEIQTRIDSALQEEIENV